MIAVAVASLLGGDDDVGSGPAFLAAVGEAETFKW